MLVYAICAIIRGGQCFCTRPVFWYGACFLVRGLCYNTQWYVFLDAAACVRRRCLRFLKHSPNDVFCVRSVREHSVRDCVRICVRAGCMAHLSVFGAVFGYVRICVLKNAYVFGTSKVQGVLGASGSDSVAHRRPCLRSRMRVRVPDAGARSESN